MSSTSNQSSTLASRVYEQVKARIVSRQVRPGDRINADQLARDLHVSVTPIRESLRWLEREGLIHNVPHRGAVVVELDRKRIEDLFAVRLQLEPFAASLAAHHASPMQTAEIHDLIRQATTALETSNYEHYIAIDGQFHRMIVELSSNTQLVVTMSSLFDRVQAFMGYTVNNGLTDRAGIALQQHAAVIEAISAGDADAASSAMRNHLSWSRANVLSAMEG